MIKAYIAGIYPRDDLLIDTWKRFEKESVSEKEFRERLEESTREVVDIQLTAKLSYIHDPQLDWHDLFRPFMELDNIKPGPLTRYFEGNKFYRKPIIKDLVKYKDGLLSRFTHQETLPPEKKWIISLPGPYTFFTLSEFQDKGKAEKSIINILIGSIEEATSLGYKFIIFHEPSIAYFNKIDWNLVKRLYLTFTETGIEYRVHLYFGDITSKLGKLLDISPYGFSIDTSYTSLENIKYLPTDNIVLGIVDSLNTLVEDAEKTIAKVNRFIKQIKPQNIELTTNSDLDYLPYKTASLKVMVLSNILEEIEK